MHTKATQHNSAAATLLGADHVAPGATGFQAAWRGTRTTRRQVP